MSILKIGWVGLGRMGAPIVLNLLKAGYQVQVYNRSKDKEKQLAGAGALMAETPASLLFNSDVICTMVSDDDAVKEVYLGENGLLAGACSGKIMVDLSTVSPATSRLLADHCSRQGAEFLDAPVSGSVQPARERSLVIMVGGSKEIYERVKPIFNAIGKLSLYLGATGAGTTAKLAINYLGAINIQAFAETILFARENGIGVRDMLTIINESSWSNVVTRSRTLHILNNEFPATFALKLMAKDLRLVAAQGIHSPLFPPLNNSFQMAAESGLGEEDVMAIFRFLEMQKVS